jgi:hypothetical protein
VGAGAEEVAGAVPDEETDDVAVAAADALRVVDGAGDADPVDDGDRAAVGDGVGVAVTVTVVIAVRPAAVAETTYRPAARRGMVKGTVAAPFASVFGDGVS